MCHAVYSSLLLTQTNKPNLTLGRSMCLVSVFGHAEEKAVVHQHKQRSYSHSKIIFQKLTRGIFTPLPQTRKFQESEQLFPQLASSSDCIYEHLDFMKWSDNHRNMAPVAVIYTPYMYTQNVYMQIFHLQRQMSDL